MRTPCLRRSRWTVRPNRGSHKSPTARCDHRDARTHVSDKHSTTSKSNQCSSTAAATRLTSNSPADFHDLRPRFIMSRYPDYLSPNITPTKPGSGFSKSQKSRARREPSGVFSLFQPAQIQQFKEAFQLIDHDKDGWVSESDLKEIFSSLGGVFGLGRG